MEPSPNSKPFLLSERRTTKFNFLRHRAGGTRLVHFIWFNYSKFEYPQTHLYSQQKVIIERYVTCACPSSEVCEMGEPFGQADVKYASARQSHTVIPIRWYCLTKHSCGIFFEGMWGRYIYSSFALSSSKLPFSLQSFNLSHCCGSLLLPLQLATLLLARPI